MILSGQDLDDNFRIIFWVENVFFPGTEMLVFIIFSVTVLISGL